ncbi:TPA: hypothetical protein ACH3X3_004906 [Trebouxia sp. C0006]
MLHDDLSLQQGCLPPGLTFEQFWARMKHHSRNLRVLEYLYIQQNQLDHIKHECHITDKRKRIKQKQYMVQWADTHILKRHLPMYLEQGYQVVGVNTCPVLRQCAGRTAPCGTSRSGKSHMATDQNASPECTKRSDGRL